VHPLHKFAIDIPVNGFAFVYTAKPQRSKHYVLQHLWAGDRSGGHVPATTPCQPWPHIQPNLSFYATLRRKLL